MSINFLYGLTSSIASNTSNLCVTGPGVMTKNTNEYGIIGSQVRIIYNKDANTLVYDGATLNGVKNVDAESVNTLIILPLAYDVANLQGYSYEQFVSLVGEQTNLTLENDGISKEVYIELSDLAFEKGILVKFETENI